MNGLKRDGYALTAGEQSSAAIVSKNAVSATASRIFSPPFALGTLLFIVVAISPWYWGGNRPLILLALELLAVAILAVAALSDRSVNDAAVVRKTAWLLLALPGVYLIPLPLDIFAALPGRELYGLVLQELDSPAEWRALSVYAHATESAWLACLVPVAVFLGVLRAPARYLRILAMTMVLTAAAQATLGLIQYGDGPESWFRFGNPNYTNSAVGTFANRNHLADLLALALPIVTALWVAAWWERRVSLRGRRDAGSGAHYARMAWWAFALLLLLLALLFTGSRGGIIAGLFGLVTTMIILARRVGRDGMVGAVTGIAVAAVAIAAVIGLSPILNRFSPTDALTDIRWTVFGSVIQAIGEFFPLGSGPGTFADVYPRFQPVALNYFVNHAHNDYLEWVVEMGVLAVVAILWLVGLYFYRWLRLWRTADGNEIVLLQMGAGIGALVMALHSTVEFNFHIPANAIFFAACLALFFHTGPLIRQASPQRRSDGPSKEESRPTVATSAASSVPNPFLSD